MSKKHLYSIFSFLIFIGLFIYIIIRAKTLSFTHDESFTFTFLNGNNGHNTANNHLLNTYLMDVCNNWFGDSELSLRLPNVLAFIFYFSGIYLIFRKLNNSWISIMFASVLLINPYILDFFSLARGYGLSLGFLMISLYFFIRNNQKYKHFEVFNKDFFFSIIFASLALFSNLSSINYFITILILFSFQFYFYNSFEKTKSKKTNLYFYIIILIPLIALYFSVERLLMLNANNELYFGTYSLGTIFNTISSSVLYSGGYSEDIFKFISKVLLFGIPLSIIVSLFWFKKINVWFKKVLFLFLVIIVGLFLENLIFHAKYPIGRSTLIYFPLIILLFYFFIEELLNKLPKRISLYLSIALLFSLIIPILIHFKNVNNFTHFADWQYDSHTKEVAFILDKETKNQEYKSKVSNNWLFEPALNYYISTRNISIEKVTRDSISPESSYIYENYFDYDSSKYEVLIKFENTETILLKNKLLPIP